MINVFIISCALSLGLISLGCLFLIFFKQPNLSHKHASPPAFCDLLEYATLTDNDIIVLKNGALCRIYELTPIIDSSTDIKELEHLRKLCQQELSKLDGKFSLQLDVIRSKDRDYLVNFNGNNKAALYFDKKRQHSFIHDPGFKTSFYLTLCYRGDIQAIRLLSNLFATNKSLKKDPKLQTEIILKNFTDKCEATVNALQTICSLKLLGINNDTIIRSHDALSFIRNCLYMDMLPQAYPKNHLYLDALLSSKDFKGGLCPQIGEKYIACVAIEGLPSESTFLILNSLTYLEHEYRFNTRFICQDKLESAINLEHYRRLWKQKRKGILAQIFNIQGDNLNADAVSQLEDLKDAQKLLDSGDEIFGKYTAEIIIMDKDFEILKTLCEKTVKAIESLGFGARVETINAIEAYLGSLPGHINQNLRRNLISSSILGDLLPLGQLHLNELQSPNPLYGTKTSSLLQAKTLDKSNILVNLHDKDLGNAIVIGPPGTGKSVFLGHLMLNLLRYKNMQIFCFDKGLSFYALNKALNGNIINLNEKTALCPFEYLDNAEDLNLALDFIETLLDMHNIKTDGYEQHEILEALKIISHKPDFGRGISALKLLISSRRIKEVLIEYSNKKDLGGFFDGEKNPDLHKDFTLFECASLFDYSKNVQIPILKHIFNLISRKFDGSHPGAIVIDEAWLMLKDPLCAKEILKWIKTLRKNNVVVILATQSLSDLKHSPIYENLIDCIKTRFFLPNPDALQKPTVDDYQNLGLLEPQLTKIATGIKKQDVFMQKGTAFGGFMPILSPQELKLLAIASPQDRSLIDDLYQKYGSNFYRELL